MSTISPISRLSCPRYSRTTKSGIIDGGLGPTSHPWKESDNDFFTMHYSAVSDPYKVVVLET